MGESITTGVPFLPPKEEYDQIIQTVWERLRLTNHGPLCQRFEHEVASVLGVDRFRAIANGTLAMQLVIKALGLTGDVVTTPFSYIATSSSLLWESCRPIFADIDGNTFNVDAAQVRAMATHKVAAILVTHVFGNPCDVESLREIADEYDIPLIFDAAHAFGVKYKGRGLMSYGDCSTISFHATKLFHTVEGGGVATADKDIDHKIAYMRSFGHDGPDRYFGVGINAKMSEFHAAMGLVNLRYLDELMQKRRCQYETYRAQLERCSSIQFQAISDHTEYNYSYMPVLLPDASSVIRVMESLAEEGIYPKRYFYPSLDTLGHLGLSGACEVSRDIADRILCLPIYHTLEDATIVQVCEKLLALVGA
jgi:dTDP-4-amino-4,6-dideoxygalactose transaminase